MDSTLELKEAFTYTDGDDDEEEEEEEKDGKHSFPLSSIATKCLRHCFQCHDLNSNFVFLESKQQMYLLVIFDIHDAGDRILECGPLRSDQVRTNIFVYMIFNVFSPGNTAYGSTSLVFEKSERRNGSRPRRSRLRLLPK